MECIACTSPVYFTRHTQTHAPESPLDGSTDVFWDGVHVGTKNQCDDDDDEDGAVSQEECRFHYQSVFIIFSVFERR